MDYGTGVEKDGAATIVQLQQSLSITDSSALVSE